MSFSQQSFFTGNNNFQNNFEAEPAPKRKLFSEINPNVAHNNNQYCEKEQMFLEPPNKNKFQGFQFKLNNDNWLDSPQYLPQETLNEADDWPDFL